MWGSGDWGRREGRGERRGLVNRRGFGRGGQRIQMTEGLASL